MFISLQLWIQLVSARVKEEGLKVERGDILITALGKERLFLAIASYFNNSTFYFQRTAYIWRFFASSMIFSWLIIVPEYAFSFARKTKQVDLKHKSDIYWVNNIVAVSSLWFSRPCTKIFLLLSVYFVTRAVGRFKIGLVTAHLNIVTKCEATRVISCSAWQGFCEARSFRYQRPCSWFVLVVWNERT